MLHAMMCNISPHAIYSPTDSTRNLAPNTDGRRLSFGARVGGGCRNPSNTTNGRMGGAVGCSTSLWSMHSKPTAPVLDSRSRGTASGVRRMGPHHDSRAGKPNKIGVWAGRTHKIHPRPSFLRGSLSTLVNVGGRGGGIL